MKCLHPMKFLPTGSRVAELDFQTMMSLSVAAGLPKLELMAAVEHPRLRWW